MKNLILLVFILSALLMSGDVLSQENRNGVLEDNLYLDCSSRGVKDTILFALSNSVFEEYEAGYANELILYDPLSLNDSDLEYFLGQTSINEIRDSLDIRNSKYAFLGSTAYQAEYDKIEIYKYVDGYSQFGPGRWERYASIDRFTGEYRGFVCTPISSDTFFERYIQWRDVLEARVKTIKSDLLF